MSIRSFGRTLRRVAGEEDGLGMPEILVALMVFAVIATTAAYGMLNALTLTQHSRSNQTAMSLASSDLDQMRLVASSDDDGVFSVLSTNPGSPITQTVGGTIYSITRQVTWQTTTGSTGACGTGTGTLQYKNVADTVTWTDNRRVQQSVTMSSAIAPLSNINSDATGTIIVMVTGAAGQPVPGLKVSITPTSGGGGSTLSDAPQNTDNAGCSFGLLVDPGSYNVTASLAGDIDINQSATATTPNSAPVSVVAGQNTVVTFSYDQAATFPLSYPGGATLPTNLPISFFHSTPGTTPFNAGSSPSAIPPSSVKAFPWADGYTILAGTYVYTAATSSASCLDTNPASWTTPRAGDNAVGVAPLPVAAGAGATAPGYAVPMGTVTVTVPSGKFITAVTTTPGAGDPGCNAGQTLNFPKASGTSMTMALPYGTWKLYSGSTSGSTTTALSLTGIVGGLLNVLGGGATSVTIDPRVAP